MNLRKRSSGTCILISIVTAATGVLVALALLVLINGAYASSAKKLDSEGEAIVERAATMLSNEDGSIDEHARALAIERIEDGIFSLGDYVISVMTDSSYLMNAYDDNTFASDICFVLYGNEASDDDISSVISLLKNKSRQFVISRKLAEIDEHYEASSYVTDNKGSSVSDCSISSLPGNEDGYTIGIRQISGSYVADGNEVRTDFFIDGVLYQGYLVSSDNQTNGLVDSSFVISWDTTGIAEGTHSVSLMIRSSDGRSKVLGGGTITVPHCLSLSNNSVEFGTIASGQSETWYALDATDNAAYVNFLDISDDIEVSIYDAYGNTIGTNDIVDSKIEVLRAAEQDLEQISAETGITDPSNMFYVRTIRSGDNTNLDEEVTYTMVQTQNVAKYNGEYYAVLSEISSAVPVSSSHAGEDQTLSSLTIDMIELDGTTISAGYDEISFLPLNGCLSSLVVRNAANGESINFFPIFESAETDYAYYTSESSSITINADIVEGYSGTLLMSNESGISRQISQGEVITLIPGANKICLTVRGFDGEIRDYYLYILNGMDDSGFYETTLSQFPESYYAGLWLLHNIHPEYNFRPYYTGLDYNAVLDNEDSGSRSLANVNTHPGWVDSSSPVYDGGGWMMATNQVVNYFLDPRNFLTPRDIFEFEMLSFDSTAQTIDGVRSIVDGSFMDSTDPDYAQIIFEAGEYANVSPYFLSSRILQEMGFSGESALCHGTLEGYEGYYNFYNIGSTPDPDIENGALINGARYAQWGRDPEDQEITEEESALLLPWDSVENAITGGAIWIASRYTEAGQYSLYFQKFDVIDNEDGLYEHQYAQNISMAYTEAHRYFEGYASIGMLDNGFTFIIPVYENMPSTFGVMPDRE